MGERNTKLCDFTNTPNDQFIASPIANPEIKVDSFEVSPGLLNLIAKEQFGGSASEDASMCRGIILGVHRGYIAPAHHYFSATALIATL